MKKIILALVILPALLGSIPLYGETYKDTQGYKDYLKLPSQYHSPEMESAYKNGFEARQKVENLTCKSGGTVKQCLDEKGRVKAVDDLGWSTTPYGGGFYVERLMTLSNMKLQYRWFVAADGSVKPDNDKAIGITAGY